MDDDDSGGAAAETWTETELAAWFYNLDLRDRLHLAQVHDSRLLEILLQQFRHRHRGQQAHTSIGSLYLVYDEDDEIIGTQSAQPYADVECSPPEVALMASLRFSYSVLQERFDGITVCPSALDSRHPTFIRTICASSSLVPAASILTHSTSTSCMGYAEFGSTNNLDWRPLRYVIVVRAIANHMHSNILQAFLRSKNNVFNDFGNNASIYSGIASGDSRLNERLSGLLEKAVVEPRRGVLRHILARLSAQFCTALEHKVLPRWESEFVGTVTAQASAAWNTRDGLGKMFSFSSVDFCDNVLKVGFLKSVFICYSGPLPSNTGNDNNGSSDGSNSAERRERPRSFFMPGDTLQRIQPQLIGALDLSFPILTQQQQHHRAASTSSRSSSTWDRSGSNSPSLFDEASQYSSSEAASSYSARSDGSDTDSGCFCGGDGSSGGNGGFTDFFAAPPSRKPYMNAKVQGFDFRTTSGNSSGTTSPFSSSTFASDTPSESDDYSSGTATPDISDASSSSPGVASPQSSPRLTKRHSFAGAGGRGLAPSGGGGDGVAAGSEAMFSAQKDPSLNVSVGSAGFYKCDAAADLPDWCTGRYRGDPSGFLSCEIGDYVAYMDSLVRDAQHVYENAIKRITAAIERHLPGANLCIFGSYATGLCIPSSDLDLVCCIPEENIQRPFRLLSRALREEPWVAQIKAIETAAFPVIKLIYRNDDDDDDNDGIPIDISFDCKPLPLVRPHQFASSASPAQTSLNVRQMAGNAFLRSRHRGIQAAELVNRFLKSTPKLRLLVIVLKQFLFEQELNKPYTGGLGSFCLLLMVKAFLNIYDKDGAVLDTGGALTAFLRCYGVDFDYARMGISLKHGGAHFNIGDPGYCKYMGAALTIEDPFDPMNNIGASSFNMIKVKHAFAAAFYNLTGKNNSGAPTILSRIMQI